MAATSAARCLRPAPSRAGSATGVPTSVAGPDNARSPEQYLHRGRICTYRWSNKFWNKVSVCFQQPRGVERIKRSEEHTSELQSLMRNSYAVFCLKKKKKHTQIRHLTRYC